MSTHSKTWRPARHFLTQPSALCQEAGALLAQVHSAEGADVVLRLTAEVTAKAALADFARTRQVRQRQSGHVCISRLLGTRCPTYDYDCPRIPAGDHLSEWCRGRETVAIVSQPYGLSPKAMQETMDFYAQLGLWVAIDTWPSWHFPGSALTVVFTRHGVHLDPRGDHP